MIRRFYVMPLNSGITEDKIDAFVQAFDNTDEFIPGLLDSSAGRDFDTRTVIWENTFVDEKTYAGSYMLHPYHMATLDNYLIADSPECITYDIYTVRYELPGTIPRIEAGIRRLVLLRSPDAAGISILESIAARAEGMAVSVFSADNVAWRRPAKDLTWTHVWEQGFTDMESLNYYLKTPEAVACSDLKGLERLGVKVQSLKLFTYPFKLKPPQLSAELPADPHPILYVITARIALEDAGTYVGLLETYYDPSLANIGAKLMYRWQSVDRAYGDVEVQSTWQLASVAAFHDLRLMTFTDPSWNHFVKNGMPLVKNGMRRFYRA